MSPVADSVKGTGVGVMAREPITVIEWQYRTSACKARHDIGRVAIYGVEIEGTPQWYGVVCGSTGGNTSTDAAQKTDIIIAALICELEEVAKDQVCIIGDLNADLEDIPMALDLVENEGWKDLGANA